MDSLSLIILFLLIGFGAFRLERAMQKRRQAGQSLPPAEPAQATRPNGKVPWRQVVMAKLQRAPTEPATTTTKPPVAPPSRTAAWLNGAIPKLRRAPAKPTLAPQFRAWVETALGHEAKLQAWLLALSPEQLQALVEHVAAYCQQLKVNLIWLVERQIDIAPALKRTTHEIVVGYCAGIWKATQIKPKLELFIEYQQMTQLTPQQQQQTLQRELLARLAAQDLVAIQPLAATLTGTEAERQAKVVEAIQQVATKDWERFATIFQTTVSQNGFHPEKPK